MNSMHTLLKFLILTVSLLVTYSPMASAHEPPAKVATPFPTLAQHLHQAASLQQMFLKTPLLERSRINSGFGYRIHPVSGKRKGHQGLDYPAPKGTPIRATAQGKITFIGVQKGYGKVIYIDHNNGYSTVYAHQSRFQRGLKKGAAIKQGHIIGFVGSTGTSTGNHLHYELRVNNQPVDPIQEKQQLAAYVEK